LLTIATEKELGEALALNNEYREHLSWLENGEPVDQYSSLGKRKHADQGEKRSTKRRKSEFGGEAYADMADANLDDDDIDNLLDDVVDDVSEAIDSSSARSSNSDSDSHHEQEGVDPEDEVTPESLKARISKTTNTIKTLQARLKSNV